MDEIREVKSKLEKAMELLEIAYEYMGDTHGYDSEIYAEIRQFLRG